MESVQHLLSTYRLPLWGWAAALSAVPALIAAVAACLFGRLHPRGIDGLLAARVGDPAEPEGAWALTRARLALAVLVVFSGLALAPLVPERVAGWEWVPAERGILTMLAHAGSLALLGVSAAWLAGAGGALAAVRVGAPLGLAAALLGSYASAWGSFAFAAGRLGHPLARALLVLVVPLAFAAAVAALPPRGGRAPSRTDRRRLAVLLAAWALTYHAADFHLGRRWGLGEGDLTRAVGLPPAEAARRLRVVVLSTAEGGPGFQEREVVLSSAEVDVSADSLRLIQGYLNYNRYRTLFLTQALRALREGWGMNWDPDRRLRALLDDGGGAAAPAFGPFLEEIGRGPVTRARYSLLEAASAHTLRDLPSDVHEARVRYESLSAAYAHFGDPEGAETWRSRIERLMPLVNAPGPRRRVEQRRGGSIAGRIAPAGGLPEGLRVGLFAREASPRAAAEGSPLCAVELAADGTFGFGDLTPGVYYLAASGPAESLPRGRSVRGAPGALRLEREGQRLELAPIGLAP